MQVRVNFWDMAGGAEYYEVSAHTPASSVGPLAWDTSELIWLCEVRREFYSDAQGCLLVFDVCAQAAGGPPSAGPSKGLEIRTAHSSSGVL